MESPSKAEQLVLNFFHRYPSRLYPSGRDLILAGDEPSGVYFIESGFVRQYDINGKNGLEFTAHTFGPGSLLPLTWALSDIPNRYFYGTMGATKVFVAPRKDFKSFLQVTPVAAVYLSQSLLHGIEGLNTRIKYLALGDARQKIYTELLYLVKHLGVREGKTVIINHSFTHQNIANLTGMARETVSHVLEQLQHDGLISDKQHRIIIHDLEKLEKLAVL